MARTAQAMRSWRRRKATSPKEQPTKSNVTSAARNGRRNEATYWEKRGSDRALLKQLSIFMPLNPALPIWKRDLPVSVLGGKAYREERAELVRARLGRRRSERLARKVACRRSGTSAVKKTLRGLEANLKRATGN